MLLTALAYCLAVVGLLGYAVFSVQQSGRELALLKVSLAEQVQKQQAGEAVASVVAASEADRLVLASHFLSNEADVLTFIASIETLAARLGLRLSTNDLTLVPATETTPAYLKTGFTVDGSEWGVMNFLKAIESLPYHSRINTVNIARADGKVSLSLTIDVTVMP